MSKREIQAPLVCSITTAEIEDEMWLEVSRHSAGAPPPRRALPIGVTGRLTLPALLALDGTAFVEAAYWTILNRPLDQAGQTHWSQQLESGISKILLLGRLQGSAEGRQVAHKLPGLRRRYWVQRLYGVKVLGSCVRVIAAVLRRGGISHVLGGTARPTRIPSGPDAAQEACARIVADLIGRLTEQEESSQRILATVASHGRTLSGVVTQNLAAGRRLSGLEDSSLESMLAMHGTLDEQGARLARLEGAVTGVPAQAAVPAPPKALREMLDERLVRAEAIVAQNRQMVADQERRIGLLLEALRTRPEPMPAALRIEDDHAVDGLYVDFEDRFRGTRADIKQRQRFYLPILAEVQAGSPGRPIVDVGCGRGEFLELLRDEGLIARGADLNGAMAASCRERGLDCTGEDALAYLGRQAAGSLGAVTGFHIIEHLPFKTMVRLFDAAFLALAPGGLIAFETPNPANLLVASRWFYLDPTHHNPIPGEMVAMVAEARGFIRVSVVNLHPAERRFAGEDTVLCEQLDQIFHGPQDYALLARKP